MTLGELAVAGATGLPSSVTVTSTAAEFADVSMAGVTSVLLNKPVTSDGVISSVVNCEFGVLMVVSSNVVALPFRLPEFGNPPTVLMVHCVVVMAAAKLPLLWAKAEDDAKIANARIIPGSNSL